MTKTKKNIKVRDLKPSKDAKGGGALRNNAGLNNAGLSNAGLNNAHAANAHSSNAGRAHHHGTGHN